MSDPLFTSFDREHRPLVSLLERWSNIPYQNARTLRQLTLNSSTDAEILGHLLASWDRYDDPPRRTGLVRTLEEPAQVHRLEGEGLPSKLFWRWHFIHQLDGNAEPLTCWPAKLDNSPCDGRPDYGPTPDFLLVLGPENTVVVMIDVAQEEDPDGTTTPHARLLTATEYLEQALVAIHTQMAEFRQRLTDDLTEIVQKRRARLTAVTANNTAALELVRRKFPALEVVRVVRVTEAVDASLPYTRGQAADLELIKLTHNSFASVVSVCNQWGTSAQSFAAVFNRLDEDSLTSLLITTLNVTLETARRETFELSGKTDIYVEVKTSGDVKRAYIGETKIWGGQAEVAANLTQLLGNTPVHITEVLLIYYVKNQEITATKQAAAQAIANYQTFHHWQDESTAIIGHPNSDYDVAVTVLYFHFPPAARKARRKSRSKPAS